MTQPLQQLAGFSTCSPLSSTFTQTTNGSPVDPQDVNSPELPARFTLDSSPPASLLDLPQHHLPLHSSLHYSYTQTLRMLFIWLILLLGLTGGWFVMTHSFVFQGRFPSTVRSINETGFSGWEAMNHLHHIAATPHMYNSDANLQVRQYIIRHVQQMMKQDKRWVLEERDTINITLPSLGGLWYESNNVVVRLKGKQPHSLALLVSAHFDSTPVSPGATDDGVAIAVMLETIRLLTLQDPLDFDVIFNFNNGEEMKLLGAYAFLHHPWFKECKGFINLEGTGAALGTRSMLFRSNSQTLVKAYARYAPYPHASILFHDLMRYVKSDTDYRAYYAFGGISGLDIAFYSYRYLYHTPRDDVYHVSPFSVQHMGDNVIGLIQSICHNETGVMLHLNRTQHPLMDPTGVLPSAKFPYYDVMGQWMVVLSQRYYSMILNSLLIFVMAAMVVKGLAVFASGRDIRHVMIMSALSLSAIVVSVMMTGVAMAVVAWIKSWWNPTSTYGAPAVNMVWMAAVILFTLTLTLHLFDRWIQWLIQSIQSTWFLYDRVPSDERDSDTTCSPSILTEWLHVGLLLFWYSLLVMTTLLASNGWNGAYLFVWWFCAYCVTMIMTFAVTLVVQVWNRQLTMDVESVSSWKTRSIQWHPQYFWVVQYGVSTCIPLWVTLDLLEQVYITLPSLLAENVGFVLGDVGLSSLLCLLMVNLVPVLRRCDIKAISAVCLAVWVVSFVYACSLFPFSYDTPHKMRFTQEWDITNTTTLSTSRVTLTNLATLSNSELLVLLPHYTDRLRNGSCTLDSCQFDTVTVPHLSEFDAFNVTSDLLDCQLDSPVCKKDQCIVQGTLKGTPRSRICSLSVLDPSSLVNVVMDISEGWITMNASTPVNASTLTGTLFRRAYSPLSSNYTEEDRVDALRLSTTFTLTFPLATTHLSIKIGCFHSEIQASETYRRLVSMNATLGSLPDFMTFTHGRYGENNLMQQIHDIDQELQEIEKHLQELYQRQAELVQLKEQLTSTTIPSLPSVSTDYARTDFSWSCKMKQLLQTYWKTSTFRYQQQEIVNAVMSERNMFVIMPTGGGKSLTFQLAALMKPGLTLVISPLVSLLQDQVVCLQDMGIKAAMLTASTGKEETKRVVDELKLYEKSSSDSTLKLVYVTPEKIAKSKRFISQMEKLYKAGNLSLMAVDEAHCCSHYGHDFRPDYKKLGLLKTLFPRTPVMCLSATCSPPIVESVLSILNLPSLQDPHRGTLLFQSPLYRSNLKYSVIHKSSSMQDTLEWLHTFITRNYPQECGIIYCLTRKDTEQVCQGLVSLGSIKACAYHADMSDDYRQQVHLDWRRGVVHVVVATIAFGMGINQPNVRYVIHHSLSKSVEGYYQESGRAGRDGLPSECILLYRGQDACRLSSMVVGDQEGIKNVYNMLRYAQDVLTCRKRAMETYFGVDSTQAAWGDQVGLDCHQCDNCMRRDEPERMNVRDQVASCLILLHSLAQENEKVTLLKLVDLWRGVGKKSPAIQSLFQQGSVTSVPKSWTKEASHSTPSHVELCERILIQLILDCHIKEDFHFTPYSTISYLVPTFKGQRWMKQPTDIHILIPEDAIKSTKKTSKVKKGSCSTIVLSDSEPSVVEENLNVIEIMDSDEDSRALSKRRKLKD